MIINKTLLQNAEPRNGNVLWAQPVGDKLQLKAYNKGKWHLVGNSNSSTDGGGDGADDRPIVDLTDIYNLENPTYQDVYQAIIAANVDPRGMYAKFMLYGEEIDLISAGGDAITFKSNRLDGDYLDVFSSRGLFTVLENKYWMLTETSDGVPEIMSAASLLVSGIMNVVNSGRDIYIPTEKEASDLFDRSNYMGTGYGGMYLRLNQVFPEEFINRPYVASYIGYLISYNNNGVTVIPVCLFVDTNYQIQTRTGGADLF